MTSLYRALAAAALVVAAVVAPSLSPSLPNAQAAELSSFNPGNIISDAVFFDSLSMTATEVQTFVSAKGAKCIAGELPCLKDYRQDTVTQAGDAFCSAYQGAAQETAATIITKIGVSCGINPRVLLVLLQKEQGLVTGTKPATSRYTKATGFGCPDTAACNPSFSGFVSQVYFAARQFQRYADGLAGSYRPGRTQTVLYNPSSSCGSQSVYISNVATAGLYNYTPYVPNAAALAAGYGTGDACSAYGNRNFYNYFTDWFGSTQSPGAASIAELYAALGSSAGTLGSASSGYDCGLVGNGCSQAFAGGSIYWSPGTGAHSIRGDLGAAWTRLNGAAGILGYPVEEGNCGLTGGGCFQVFQGGSIYWTPTTGAHFIRGSIRETWRARGWENGTLGYPTTDEICGLAGGGCRQDFQQGSLVWSPATGVWAIDKPTAAKWASTGRVNGVLGYPIGVTHCGLPGGGCFQDFQGGSVYWSPATPAVVTRGSIRVAWARNGWESGWLGYPTSDETCTVFGAGCFENFQNGAIYWGPTTGAHPMTAPMLAQWRTLGDVTGSLGYPISDPACNLVSDGCVQGFQGGSMYWSNTSGASFVRGSIRVAWGELGYERGALGYPVSGELCGLRAGGCFEDFQGGSIYWSLSTGAHSVRGPIYQRWAELGWETGALGYPTGDPVNRNGLTTQRFQGGLLTLDPATGTVSRS